MSPPTYGRGWHAHERAQFIDVVQAELSSLGGRFRASGEPDWARLIVESLDACLMTGEPALLVDALRQVRDRSASAGGVGIEQAMMGPVWGVLETVLPADMKQAAMSWVGEALAAAGSAPEVPSPTGAAGEYLDLVLGPDREGAMRLVKSLLADGMDVGSLLVDVLEVAQHEVGRQWQLGRLSWVKEHYCTAITQRALSEVYERLFAAPSDGRRLLAIHAPGDGHRLGLRMVVDLLQYEGWTTTYSTDRHEPGRLPDLLSASRADLLAISASGAGQIPAVADLVEGVKSDPRTHDIPVLVGGRPFTIDSLLVAAVGADATAWDARHAITVCAELTGGRSAGR